MTALALKKREELTVVFEPEAELFSPFDLAFCQITEDSVIASALSLHGEGFLSDYIGLPAPSSVLEGGRMLSPQVAHTMAALAYAAHLVVRWTVAL